MGRKDDKIVTRQLLKDEAEPATGGCLKFLLLVFACVIVGGGGFAAYYFLELHDKSDAAEISDFESQTFFVSFDYYDNCMNYELPGCTNPAVESLAPYNGMMLNNGTWYFVDKISIKYTTYRTVDYNETEVEGVLITADINYAHDTEAARSKSYSLKVEDNQVVDWIYSDKVLSDGAYVYHECYREQPEEFPSFALLWFLKNPSMFLGSDSDASDDVDFGEDEMTGNYTTFLSYDEYFEILTDAGEDLSLYTGIIPPEGIQGLAEQTVPAYLIENLIFNNDSATVMFDSVNFDVTTNECVLLGEDFLPDELKTRVKYHENVTACPGCSETTSNLTDPTFFDDYTHSDYNITDLLDEIYNNTAFDNFVAQLNETRQDGDPDFNNTRRLVHVDALHGCYCCGVRKETLKNCMTCSSMQMREDECLVQCPVDYSLEYYYDRPAGEDAFVEVLHRDDPLVYWQQHHVFHKIVDYLESRNFDLETETETQQPSYNASRTVSQSIVEEATGFASLDAFLADMDATIQALRQEEFEEEVPYGNASLAVAGRQLKYYKDKSYEKTKTGSWVIEHPFAFSKYVIRKPPQGKVFLSKFIFKSVNLIATQTESFVSLQVNDDGGLPHAKELVRQLDELEAVLMKHYGKHKDIEKYSNYIFTASNLVRKLRVRWGDMRWAYKIIKKVAKVMTYIPFFQIGTLMKPVAQVLSAVDSLFLGPVDSKLKFLNDKVVEHIYDPLLEFLKGNDLLKRSYYYFAQIVARFIRDPVAFTRKCKSTDDVARLLVDDGAVADLTRVLGAALLEGLLSLEVKVQQLYVGTFQPFLADLTGFADFFEGIFKFMDLMSFFIDPIKDFLNKRRTITLSGLYCKADKYKCKTYACGTKWCYDKLPKLVCQWNRVKNKRGKYVKKLQCHWTTVTSKRACGIIYCDKDCRWVQVPKWCKKTFNFSLQEIIDAVTGVFDLIMGFVDKLFNEVVKMILKAVWPNGPDFLDPLGKYIDMFTDMIQVAELSLPRLDMPQIKAATCLNDFTVGGDASNDQRTPITFKSFWEKKCGPNIKFAAFDFICDNDAELLYGVEGMPPFYKLQYAITTAKPNQDTTVVVDVAEVEFVDRISVPEDVHITLVLSGISATSFTATSSAHFALERGSSLSSSAAITFRGGRVTDEAGGSIFVSDEATLELSNAVFADNRVAVTGDSREEMGGGAIYSRGSLRLTDCSFENNQLNAAVLGAYHSMQNSIGGGAVFLGNYEEAGTDNVLEGCSFSGNTCSEVQGCGGAILLHYANRLNVTGSSFVGNTYSISGKQEEWLMGRTVMVFHRAELGVSCDTQLVDGQTLLQLLAAQDQGVSYQKLALHVFPPPHWLLSNELCALDHAKSFEMLKQMVADAPVNTPSVIQVSQVIYFPEAIVVSAGQQVEVRHFRFDHAKFKEYVISITFRDNPGPLARVRFDGQRSTRHFVVKTGGTLTLNGLIMYQGFTSLDGGSVLVEQDASLFVNYCSFYGSTAQNGGAIDVGPGSELNAQNSEFRFNEALDKGGAVHGQASSSVTLASTLDSFIKQGNDEGDYDDFYYSVNSGLNEEIPCRLRSNRAATGGVYHGVAGSSLTVSGCEARYNQVTASGGAFYLSEQTTTFVETELSDNEATVSGNTIYAFNSMINHGAGLSIEGLSFQPETYMTDLPAGSVELSGATLDPATNV